MQHQCEGAKHGYSHQCEFVHDLQLAVYGVDQAHLDGGGRHQNGGANIDVVNLEGSKEQYEREKFQQYFHEGMKCNEAEFMQ